MGYDPKEDLQKKNVTRNEKVQIWNQTTALPFTSCVTLGDLVKGFESFHLFKVGMILIITELH